MSSSAETAPAIQGIPRRVALVTGGAGGIGGGVVIALTWRGFDVIVSDRSFSPERKADLREKADPAASIAFVAGDIADLEDHPRFVDEVYAAFGRLDCLVNNAGVSVASRGDLLDVSVASYDTNFAVSTRAAFFLTQAVSRRMLAAESQGVEGSRSVVFISSSNAAIAAPERGEYAMSKAAVSMMAKLFAVRLAARGICVYEVRPGLIRTPMTAVARDRFDALLAEGFTPINRWGTPEDIGQAVATLASGEVPFATGTAVQIDGGMHIHYY
ncbi:3-ketoacyl-ACP reductase [Roseomonas sp. KE2513]|uniref:3-ketoacyl-ACP reductase n=1 Tax=Roseomonas sp. KE2513 TaxID=2479202 RepID=UPI0018DFC179|nr:3-ketoacyl-ACP reductase [Roseomonas sp. KE2513]MBI0539351.1 3-ketoacyl-ACP reductase [Roseomonas sp. KE2513]